MRHPKYKTEAERMEAHKEANSRYRKKHNEILKEYQRDYQREAYRKRQLDKGLEVRGYRNNQGQENNNLAMILSKIEFLESENKEIKITLDEVLKDNRRLENSIKWRILKL